MKKTFFKSLVIALFTLSLTTSCAMISGKQCHNKSNKECDKMCKSSKDSSNKCQCKSSKK